MNFFLMYMDIFLIHMAILYFYVMIFSDDWSLDLFLLSFINQVRISLILVMKSLNLRRVTSLSKDSRSPFLHTLRQRQKSNISETFLFLKFFKIFRTVFANGANVIFR